MKPIIFQKLIAVAGAAAALFGFLVLPSSAAGQNNCIDLSLQNTPLFADADLKPGDKTVRTATVTNVLSQANGVRVWAENYYGWPAAGAIPADDLSRALNFTVRIKDGADIFGGAAGKKTLYDFFSAGPVILDTLAAGQSRIYELEIYFDRDLGNEWQKKTTKFDIVFGSECGSGGDPGDPGNPGQPGQPATTTVPSGNPSGGGISGQYMPGYGPNAKKIIPPQIAGAVDERPSLPDVLQKALGVSTGVNWPASISLPESVPAAGGYWFWGIPVLVLFLGLAYRLAARRKRIVDSASNGN